MTENILKRSFLYKATPRTWVLSVVEGSGHEALSGLALSVAEVSKRAYIDL